MSARQIISFTIDDINYIVVKTNKEKRVIAKKLHEIKSVKFDHETVLHIACEYDKDSKKHAIEIINYFKNIIIQ